MKAIILSAGKGSRLLPHSEFTPKCLLPLGHSTNILNWQLSQLEIAGIEEVVVVIGFHAEKVEQEVANYAGQMPVRTLYNPFFKVADNLGSVWIAREEMKEDFIILNGDTLFTSNVVVDLMKNAEKPITVTVAYKESFDDDDMKVTLKEGGLVHAVSKKIPLEDVNAESIGMILFQGEGVQTFRQRVESLMRVQTSLGRYYLSVIDALAKEVEIGTSEAGQENWGEVDFPLDLERAQIAVNRWMAEGFGAQQKRVAG